MGESPNRYKRDSKMKHKELSYILIATLFQGLLFLYPLSGNTGILFILFYFCPLPLFYIGSAWGYKYLCITSMITIAVISIYGLKLAIAYALIFALPAIYFSYYLNLHKESENGDLIWYPINLIFSKLVILSLLLVTVIILYLGLNIQEYQKTISSIYSNIYQIRPDLELTLEINNLGIMSASLPSIFVTFWIIIFTVNLWLGLKLSQKLGNLRRTWQSFDKITLSRTHVYILGFALIVAFLGNGLLMIIASSCSVALLVGYTINGLSVIHYITTANKYRSLILTSIYVMITLFAPLLIPLTIVGILDYKNTLREKFK